MSFNFAIKSDPKVSFVFSVLLSLFCLLSIAYADNTVNVQLSRENMAVGETVTVSFNLKSRASTTPDFSPLEKDFRVLGTNYGSSFNVLNGVTQSHTFWQVTLEPKTAGELWIPEINFGNAKSKARKLIVKEASSISNHSSDESAFVQAELSTTSPYVQSQVLYTFKLFYRSQFENPVIESPQIKNVILTPFGDEKHYQTTVKGEQFFVFEKNFAIFPQKAEKIIIPPTRFRALAWDNRTGFNSGILNDPFLVSSEPITLATPSYILDVHNIPQNFQGKVWLPAKNISLNEEWSHDANHWETGNPVTRTITIVAEGLRADQIPDLAIEQIPNVNVYTDPPHRSNRFQDKWVIGTWQQKITYIPNQPQSFTIPPLQLKWWNTQTNTEMSGELKASTVQVQGKLVPVNAKPPVATLTNEQTNSSPLTKATSLKCFYLIKCS